jgi:long-chain acyl-CoA synthetase
VANTASIDRALHLRPGRDRIAVVLPMFHSFAATVGIWFPLCRGYGLVPLARFDPQPLAEAVRSLGITVLPLVPSLWGLLLRLPAEHDAHLAGLRFGISGGAAMPATVMQAIEARFGKPVYEGDGPTECGPVTSINPVGGERRVGSIGQMIPGVAMQIVDAAGKELPTGEVGEIVVRGSSVMLGYWNRPADTAAAFFGDWMRTGDLVYVDADGYFYIVDRSKDMLIVNGMNVYPRVIEEILYTLPPVREAAVVGEPDPRHGEIPVAFVSLKSDQACTAAEVRAFCQAHLGRHEVPRHVVLVDDLPRTATGKINKRALRRQGEAERGVQPAPDADA